MDTVKTLRKLGEKHGTPLFVVDHNVLRKNYATFKKYLPRVQAYYAVKANPDPAIVKTLFDAGSSFDVASMPEFNIVYDLIKRMPARQRQDWIWDKIIYANPIKVNDALRELDQYKALVTYDNHEEIRKIKKYAPNSGLALRLSVPNTGAMCELSSKCGAASGEAVDLILAADKAGLVVEGLSFHVGSQTTNFENFVQAINLAASIFEEAKGRGYTKMNLLDIGGGFPAPYDETVKPFSELARKINAELNRLFPKDIQVLAEPGRFMVATAGTAVSQVIGKAQHRIGQRPVRMRRDECRSRLEPATAALQLHPAQGPGRDLVPGRRRVRLRPASRARRVEGLAQTFALLRGHARG